MKIKLIGGASDGQFFEIPANVHGYVRVPYLFKRSGQTPLSAMPLASRSAVIELIYRLERITTLDGHLMVCFHESMTLLDALQFLIDRHPSP